VTTAYRIKEVAERTGFSTATLRYYEDRGLLPQPPRTRSGYRQYDEQAVERLAFIARAKQLGCSLDEIGELSAAWDGDECGPIQDRLRLLVAEKLQAVERQLAELATLRGELERSAANLERHRPDGPCDARCGCVASGDDVAVELDPSGRTDTPVVCTLDRAELGDRFDAWQRALRRGAVISRHRIDGGIRLQLGASADLPALVELARAEQSCCRFFTFAMVIDDRGAALEVRAPALAATILDELFGTR
jgi:MerR family copper efflux transcriptional regulator